MDALGADVRAEVARRLDAIERDHGVRILFAAESGSRAWGFASPDSDYDVRFVYVRPLDDYLQLSPPRDVIETPIEGDWDVNGWDLKKALLLLRKGNAVVIEWLRSPLIYREVGPTPDAMRRFADRFADPESSIRHYGGLMHGLVERSLSGREQVKLKAYIYVMRCACAVAWVRARGTVPPMALSELRAIDLPPAVSQALDVLLAAKTGSGEKLGQGARIPVLDGFVSEQEAWVMASGALKPLRVDPAFLEATDTLFRSAVLGA
jgi:predicted nucleotidyltransferase